MSELRVSALVISSLQFEMASLEISREFLGLIRATGAFEATESTFIAHEGLVTPKHFEFMRERFVVAPRLDGVFTVPRTRRVLSAAPRLLNLVLQTESFLLDTMLIAREVLIVESVATGFNLTPHLGGGFQFSAMLTRFRLTLHPIERELLLDLRDLVSKLIPIELEFVRLLSRAGLNGALHPAPDLVELPLDLVSAPLHLAPCVFVTLVGAFPFDRGHFIPNEPNLAFERFGVFVPLLIHGAPQFHSELVNMACTLGQFIVAVRLEVMVIRDNRLKLNGAGRRRLAADRPGSNDEQSCREQDLNAADAVGRVRAGMNLVGQIAGHRSPPPSSRALAFTNGSLENTRSTQAGDRLTLHWEGFEMGSTRRAIRNRVQILLITAGVLVFAHPRAMGQEVELPSGWKWEFEPQDVTRSIPDSVFSRLVGTGAVTLHISPKELAVIQQFRIVGPDEAGSKKPEFQPYLLTAENEMISGGSRSSMSNGHTELTTWRINPSDAGGVNAIARLGFASLDFEGKKQRAAEASRLASADGASTLPLPVVGEPMKFELPLMDGTVIRSDDLQGKVVLIDCWATWCGPCMAKMPELRDTHSEFASEGLVIIGVNFDEDIARARTAIEDERLDWPQIHAPSSAQGKEYWAEITGISSLPRLFLIDRDGMLRHDFYPHNLRETVAEAIKVSKQADG
ncbi:MAG: peroxiredoxin family protein [Phycisphaerales bacterium]